MTTAQTVWVVVEDDTHHLTGSKSIRGVFATAPDAAAAIKRLGEDPAIYTRLWVMDVPLGVLGEWMLDPPEHP